MDQQEANGAGDYMVQSQDNNGDNMNGGASNADNGASGANSSDAKRAKLDTMKTGAPSRVIHIRNIPSDVTEAEIIHLGIPFGRVTNVLVLKGKNQAFLEMEDEQSQGRANATDN